MKISPEDIPQMEITDLLNREFDCECGKNHSVYIDEVVIGKNVLDQLPGVLEKFNFSHAFLVADTNTYEVAGEKVKKLLGASNIKVTELVYIRKEDLVPDERALGEFALKYDSDADVIISVGSGVICDIVKYMSLILDVPSIAVATAPSMDGYASDCSAFIIDGVKRSIESAPPKAIIGDVNILKNAPMDMILSGLGDMLGKYSALRDWKLGKIVLGEYYCETVSKLTRISVDNCAAEIIGYKKRGELAIENLMKGLVLVGIAMSFVGNSRPASGAEHHVSHLWEMMSLMGDTKPVFHGTQVGIGTVLANKIAEDLIAKELDFDELKTKAKDFDEQKWRKDIERIYKDVAPEIIELNERPYKLRIEERLDRLEIVEQKWDHIVQAIKSVPSSQQIEHFLNQAGAPAKPQDIGIDNGVLRDTIGYAMEIRDRYTIFRLLWDMGLLEKFRELSLL